MYPSACELNPLHKQRRCFATSGSSTLRPSPGTHGCSCSCSCPDSGSGATFLHYPRCRGPQQTAYAPLLYTRWEVSLFEHAKVVLLLGEIKGERCHRCKRRAAADVALRPFMHAPLSQCSRLVPPPPPIPLSLSIGCYIQPSASASGSVLKVFSVVGAWSAEVPVPTSASDAAVACDRGNVYVAVACVAPAPAAFLLHIRAPTSAAATAAVAAQVDISSPFPGDTVPFASVSLIVSPPPTRLFCSTTISHAWLGRSCPRRRR